MNTLREATTPSIGRPDFCPTCGRSIGPQEPIVRIEKGPWTCDGCDGKSIPHPQQPRATK